MTEPTSLDALFGAARKHIQQETETKAKAKKTRQPAEVEQEAISALFANPENWERKRGIALIHAETQTLLGNFSEYVHKKVFGARKLLREETPILVSATETVEGNWWLGAERRPEPKQEWHTQKSCVLHVHLGELQLHAPAVELTVHLHWGGIARAELSVETTFAQTAEGVEQLVVMPAETDILSCMTRDCKVKLRMEVGV